MGKLSSQNIFGSSSLVILGYHYLPPEIAHLVDDNGNLKFEAYFERFYLLWVEDLFRTLNFHHWLSLVIIGYQ